MAINKLRGRNLLIFLNAFWVFGKGMSGGDQMLIQIFKRIGHNFRTIYCYTNSDGRTAVERETTKFTFLVSWAIFDRIGVFQSYVLRTIQALTCLFIADIDVVYSGSDFFPDVLPAFFYKLCHPECRWVQCVFHIYPDWRVRPGSRLRGLAGQVLQRFSLLFIRRADAIVNINGQVKSELVKRGFDPDKIVINPPGIDLACYTEESKPEPDFDVIFLARLNPSKGVFDLPRIWAHVISQMPEARLGIIGSGADDIVSKLAAGISEAGLEGRAVLMGYLEERQARALLRGAKVFISPSYEEGFGIAIAEALACGVRVVAWDLPVYDEVFTGCITQVRTGGLKDFADAVVSVLRTYGSPDNERKVLAGKKFVERYGWDSISARHLQILCGN